MTDKDIKGVIVQMLTPLNPDETVDIPSDTMAGQAIVGSTTASTAYGHPARPVEAFANLPDSERIKGIEATLDEVAGRVPVIDNISSTSTLVGPWTSRSRSVKSSTDGIALTPP